MVQRHTRKENSHPHKIKSQNTVEIKSPREIPGKVLGGYAQGLGFNSFKNYLKKYNEMNSIFILFFKNWYFFLKKTVMLCISEVSVSIT